MNFTTCYLLWEKSTSRQALGLSPFLYIIQLIYKSSLKTNVNWWLCLYNNKSVKTGGWENWHPMSPKSLGIIQRVHWCASYHVKKKLWKHSDFLLSFTISPNLLLLIRGTTSMTLHPLVIETFTSWNIWDSLLLAWILAGDWDSETKVEGM